ncbi:MAG: hypothetical protein A2W93_07385 [Bacteroidetes bacterium GWF2_43_63]|nr:MAG: hypothetical protein A2W94_15455 [Bacteroidetes bacterium GWE2_42_42]OFY54050.1 MAG: hypothetical protein A2W93_07385 [Bacteroidetes bacterium GWF2_43_63]HCB63540.1 integrase [Bacteroidales bacterium]HCY23214.1 integrase [Bacteroidales bacterium]
MLWWYFPLLFVTGLIVGFVNTIAGSGSFLSLPVLIFTGMPANVANGTNRISILASSLTGVLSFNRKNYFDIRNAAILAAFAIPGAIAGSFFVIEISDQIVEKIIGYVMLAFAVLTLWRPMSFNRKPTPGAVFKIKWFHGILFILIGFYGGFIQAGVGIFMLFALVLSVGYDLVNANSIKLALTLVFTPFSLAVFIMNDQVEWIPGLVLAAGSILGALLGARIAIRKGIGFMKLVLFAVLLLSAAKLIFS